MHLSSVHLVVTVCHVVLLLCFIVLVLRFAHLVDGLLVINSSVSIVLLVRLLV